MKDRRCAGRVRISRNIYRFEYGQNRAIVVSLTRRSQRREKFFYCGLYGGEQKALKAAQAYWRGMVARLPAARPIKTRSATNTSGVVGVSRRMTRNRSGTMSVVYCARWDEPERRRRARTFSVAKYGAALARELAIQARQEAVARLLAPPGRAVVRRR